MCKSTCGDNAYFKGIIYTRFGNGKKIYAIPYSSYHARTARVCVAYIKCKWLLIIFAI